MARILSRDFYNRNDVCLVARQLLGKYLVSNINGVKTSGKIVETEAYNGRTDKACHAFDGLRTSRTETMYLNGGTAYVYLCYGIHNLFNVVTNAPELADAVLIRALEPDEGVDIMMTRRKLIRPDFRLTAGPGCLSQALGLDRNHDKTDLLGNMIWLEDRNETVPDEAIVSGQRVGVAYAKEDALLPWRFSIKNNPWVSKAKPDYSSQP